MPQDSQHLVSDKAYFLPEKPTPSSFIYTDCGLYVSPINVLVIMPKITAGIWILKSLS